MKKLIFILFIFISVLSLGQQRKQSITWLRVEDITNIRYFIWQGDTIDFDDIKVPITSIELEDDYLKFYRGEDILDSVFWDYTQTVDTFKIEGDSILFKITGDDLQYLNISSLSSKLDTVAHDSTLTGQGTVNFPLKIDSTILSNSQKNTYEITLPIAGTLAGSIISATEGTDYPTGWNLSASGSNLEIGHNTDRYVANVTVFYNTGGEGYRQLVNFQSAYNNIQNYNKDSLTIVSISEYYTQYKLKVYLLMQ